MRAGPLMPPRSDVAIRYLRPESRQSLAATPSCPHRVHFRSFSQFADPLSKVAL